MAAPDNATPAETYRHQFAHGKLNQERVGGLVKVALPTLGDARAQENLFHGATHPARSHAACVERIQ